VAVATCKGRLVRWEKSVVFLFPFFILLVSFFGGHICMEFWEKSLSTGHWWFGKARETYRHQPVDGKTARAIRPVGKVGRKDTSTTLRNLVVYSA